MDDFFGNPRAIHTRTTWTDTAQICMNGHVINAAFEDSPIHNKKYCSECGESTLIACIECNAKIPGQIHYANVMGAARYELPSFCAECGKSFPWTARKLKAARDLAAEIEELSPVDMQVLDTSIEEITRNNPQAQVGATRIKKILAKVGNTTGEILHKVIVDVSSETAKKILLGS